MKKKLLLLLMLCAALPCWCQDLVTVNHLVVWTKDGAKTEYCLMHRPTVKFVGDKLSIVSDQASAEYDRSELKWFTFEKITVDGISQPRADERGFSLTDEQLQFDRLKRGTTVEVYAPDGKMTLRRSVQRDGVCNISLSSLPVGVYIVKVSDGHTFKITKR